MLLMNPHPHYIRINPFADPQTIRRIEDELRAKGGVLSTEAGEKRCGFHSFIRRDCMLDGLRARFGHASVDAEDGPYYVLRPAGRTGGAAGRVARPILSDRGARGRRVALGDSALPC